MRNIFTEDLDNIKPYLLESLILDENRFVLDKRLCDITAQEYKNKKANGVLAGAIELKKRYKILDFVCRENRIRLEKYIDEKISNNFEEYRIVKMAFSERDIEEILPLLPPFPK